MSRSKILWLVLGLALGSTKICFAQTTTVFDVLVATETLTVVGTTTLQGNAFSVGLSSFVVKQGKVGISTASPVGLFTVGNGTITVLSSGLIGIGTSTPSALFHAVGAPISGSGTQFKWIASSGSLRAGEVSGKAWDNIGLYSMAFGLDNEAKGFYSSISGGRINITASSFSVIGGGYNNAISSGINNTGLYTVIGGGAVNDSRYFAHSGFIGGGVNNSIQKEGAAIASGSNNVSSGFYSYVGGGGSNTADGTYPTVGGGNHNALSSCDYCTIGGGGGNNATGAAGAVIAGGGISLELTTVGNVAGGISASVLGGTQNTATGDFSTTLGGFNNRATAAYSIASGRNANAATKGSFVWADSQNTDVTSSVADEFRTRAGGGYVLLSTPTAPTVIVSSGAVMISTSATAASAVPNIFISSANGNVGIGTASPTTTLDVNGSAQFGSGPTKSTFTSTGNLTLASVASITGSSGTFTAMGSNIYTLTTSSGIHILAGGITWADGTTSITASTGSGGGSTVYVSSWGIVPPYNNSAVTYLNVCVPGSTRTFTPTLSAIDIINFGTVDQGNTGQDCAIGALLDGNYAPPITATGGLRIGQNSYVQNASFTIPAVPVTANVSHTVCLTVACGSSGPTINGSGSSFTVKGRFGARDAW